MPNPICQTCGTQYPEMPHPPDLCPICLDERQWVRWEGQAWTTREELGQAHWTRIKKEGDGVYGIGTEPGFAIGQRPLLIQRGEGNILWDCMSFFDEAALEAIGRLGGLKAIAISHPHFFSSMVDWSEAFGGIPIYLHEAHRRHVVRPSSRIRYWSGDRFSLGEDLTLLRVGGHYRGSTVLHWAKACGGKGALFPGDSIRVANDRDWLCFMYSYVNFIPLSPARVQAIGEILEPYPFERLYGYWFDHNVMSGAKEKLRQSIDRYCRFIFENPPETDVLP